MKRIAIFSILLVAITLLSASCCSCRYSNKLVRPLATTEWKLVQMGGREISAEGDSFTMVFHSDGTITGVCDCNRLTASYTTTPTRDLRIENIGTTRRLCQNHADENEFWEMLSSVTHYEMDADIMILLSNGRVAGMMKAK
ncbi:MAG: META domain-containing protein [Alistipes sp.]|nr:META domain-containing protein [Alistipes sp.]